MNRHWLVPMLSALATAASSLLTSTAASAAGLTYSQSPVVQVSGDCSGQNAEVEQATDPTTGYIYEDWMGCGGILFSRSTDHGRSFSPAISVPGSVGNQRNSWDPALAVGSDGVVYAAFMRAKDSDSYPVVATSFDHGATFPQVAYLQPPDHKNWGDREFLTADPTHPNIVYLTYDYGPSRASVSYLCSPSGSCGFATGQLNVVMQKSTDHGATWSSQVHVSPGFPASGGDSAPIYVEANGRVDVLYQGYKITSTTTYTMDPAHQYFTSSTDGGATWSTPVEVGADRPNDTMSLDEWWIDGALAVDAGGNLFASWDTQAGLGQPDVGWLSYSTDHGQTWSSSIQVTHDNNAPVPHIMEVTAGPKGTVYVSWLTIVPVPHSSATGYAEFLQPYAIGSGWQAAPIQVSGSVYGDPNTWPGDTTGLSTLASNQVVLSWGSGVRYAGEINSEIFSTIVTFNQ